MWKGFQKNVGLFGLIVKGKNDKMFRRGQGRPTSSKNLEVKMIGLRPKVLPEAELEEGVDEGCQGTPFGDNYE